MPLSAIPSPGAFAGPALQYYKSNIPCFCCNLQAWQQLQALFGSWEPFFSSPSGHQVEGEALPRQAMRLHWPGRCPGRTESSGLRVTHVLDPALFSCLWFRG